MAINEIIGIGFVLATFAGLITFLNMAFWSKE